MTKQIVIEIAPDGSLKVEGVGFSGPSCKKATEAFEKALGTVTASKAKPELYQRDEKVRVTA